MTSNTKWEVVNFFVRASTADGIEDSLYANSRMQVPVSVFIKALVQGTTKHYYLTQAELDSIQLVDYDDPTQTLSGTWTYSTQKNGFPCTEAALVKGSMTGARGSRDEDDDDNTPQLKVYRVSTSSVEKKNVGASITQPDGTVVATRRGSYYDSHVTLEGREPITYTTDNITVTKENPANGTFTMDWTGGGKSGTSTSPWSQDNYYVSTTQHALHKAEIYTYDTTGSGNGTDSDSRLANCYAKRTPGTEMKLFFIWDDGPEATKTVGLDRKTTNVQNKITYTLTIHANAAIQVNQKRGALCLSRLAFRLKDAIWGDEWSYDKCGFTLYDTFGNMGTFYAKFQSDPYYVTASSNSDAVVIGNANPVPSAAGSSSAT
ncbi:hypothetical protein K505DRAFT_405097 [Melanomma pulvis-pyrius CBS 109.77]|uniref:Uncharacterized protein n=1 Tax=Melanomma pulvis-pyrius CBS 109.77 TaxID=1314802 RepID=A0A6A6XPZ2_9PLEO|nr:hypothetical protein K505DRAFT_405097 [Melanomma pulvis-pyrius CBS 109.77]